LVTGCDKEQVRRGLCHAHYNYCSCIISRGKTTWKALEEAGKILPKKNKTSVPAMAYFLGL
jgi:hypothetical protein